MKKISLLILIIHSYYIGFAQCEDCPKDKDISTNPAAPENCEVDEAFPAETNQFLNSFDWAKTDIPNPQPGTTFSFNPIPLNPNAGWQVPDYTNPSIFYMQSPFYQGYLNKPSGSPLANFDFAWEDGWELMYMNTGYFPNGDVYQDPTQNNNPIVTVPLPLQQTKVPYIVIYNRYSGKLRTFFNVYSELGTVDDIKLDMGYITASGDISGIFRHGNGYDTPLDQKTSTHAFSTSFENGNNNTSWFMADAQLGYDPCVCNYESEFQFKLWGLQSQDINLYGRSLSTEVPLQDSSGKPTYNNWLNMNTIDAALGSDGSGALIYKNLDGMLSDYQEELVKYKDNLNEYNTLGNQAQRAVIGLGKTALNAGLSGLVPEATLSSLLTNAVGIIGSADGDGLAYNYTNTNAKFKAFDKSVSKNLKSTVGTMSDALFTHFIKTPSKPTKPTMPTATLTEMKIQGTMIKSTNVDIGNLYTPGSFKFGGSFSPSSYPIYNEPVGLFALLETPSIIESEPEVITSTTEPYAYDARFYKLKSPLKYRLNRAVDIDYKKTELYVQIKVEFENYNNLGPLFELYNFKPLKSVDIPGSSYKSNTVASDWYPIEGFGEHSFGLEAIGSNYYSNILQIKKVTIKVMADMYFLSDGFNGAEKNSTQVFTYLLWGNYGDIDHIASKGERIYNKDGVFNLIPGALVLENEVIETTDDFVSEVVGNIIYVNAETIELKGNITVASGYEAELQAYWGIESDPTAEIGVGIGLSIKQDFYNFPETIEVDDTELGNYCTGTNKKYQSNQAKTKRATPEDETLENTIEYKFNIYPNPSLDMLNIKSDIKNSSVDLLNVDGKLISTYQYEGYTGQYDVSALSAGLYFVRLQTPKGYKYLRFVKQ